MGGFCCHFLPLAPKPSSPVVLREGKLFVAVMTSDNSCPAEEEEEAAPTSPSPSPSPVYISASSLTGADEINHPVWA